MSGPSDRVFFRAGYVTSLDAWERYLSDGHGIRLDADDDAPDCEWLPDEDDEEFEEGQESGEPTLPEEDEPLLAKQRSIFNRLSDYQGNFRGLYRAAPPEVKARLVLPHTFTRIIKHPELGGTYHEWNLFIPTSWSSPSMRTKGPGDVDRQRIQAFVEEANGLIEDHERREAAGFKFQEPDFKFERFPDWAISRPLLSDKELSNLIHAGPDSMRLWGISPREFLHPYMS
ncbi:hypothetical protein GSI_14354 [Ganoderma sinense ZZ0214-1]|uniref:Uncharacterized protein n=1 Tax=Ganoderma sinense ZZ0214-1 TaxID=1077348 RepID=A0A2G8RNG3_9APHY|nr:hypothetical protein GSI_14354 [Ganoderma sinense ZZ0214-1]